MAAQLNFLQIDALVPLAGAADLKEGFTRVPLTLCPPFSGAVRCLRARASLRARCAALLCAACAIAPAAAPLPLRALRAPPVRARKEEPLRTRRRRRFRAAPTALVTRTLPPSAAHAAPRALFTHQETVYHVAAPAGATAASVCASSFAAAEVRINGTPGSLLQAPLPAAGDAVLSATLHARDDGATLATVTVHVSRSAGAPARSVCGGARRSTLAKATRRDDITVSAAQRHARALFGAARALARRRAARIAARASRTRRAPRDRASRI
jgi:hypothetical protein